MFVRCNDPELAAFAAQLDVPPPPLAVGQFWALANVPTATLDPWVDANGCVNPEPLAYAGCRLHDLPRIDQRGTARDLTAHVWLRECPSLTERSEWQRLPLGELVEWRAGLAHATDTALLASGQWEWERWTDVLGDECEGDWLVPLTFVEIFASGSAISG